MSTLDLIQLFPIKVTSDLQHIDAIRGIEQTEAILNPGQLLLPLY
jgi:hypothetical protein